MFIVALLIGGMVLPLSAQQDIRQRQETEATLAQVREALIGFAVINGRLPRPAASATDGSERAADCATDDDCTGFIPWAAIGVQRTDAWDQLLRYSVSPAFANVATPITLASIANRRVQTRDAAGVITFLAGNAACATVGACIPAVVFSQGARRWNLHDEADTSKDGSTTNGDEDTNNSGTTTFISRIATDNTGLTGGEFDDLVTWVSGNILISRMVSAGKL